MNKFKTMKIISKIMNKFKINHEHFLKIMNKIGKSRNIMNNVLKIMNIFLKIMNQFLKVMNNFL
jgi:hypothetical protein